MPTLMLLRSPASVTSPGVDVTSSSCSAVTCTSSRLLVQLVGPVAEDLVEDLRGRSRTMPGCATQEPSKPSLASRVLSSRTFCKARSLTSASRRSG